MKRPCFCMSCKYLRCKNYANKQDFEMNHSINLPSFRITTRFFLRDLSQCDRVNSWSCNTRNTFKNLDMLEKFDSIEYCDMQTCNEKLKFNDFEKWNVFYLPVILHWPGTNLYICRWKDSSEIEPWHSEKKKAAASHPSALFLSVWSARCPRDLFVNPSCLLDPGMVQKRHAHGVTAFLTIQYVNQLLEQPCC